MGLGQLFKIHLHAEVIALLGRGDDVRVVFAGEHGFGAVLEEFGVAFYADGDEDLRFGGGGGDVEGDVVEVGDDLVDGCWGGTGRGC